MTNGAPRTAILKLLSRSLERSWDAGLSLRPELSVEAIVARAARRAGGEPVDGPWSTRLAALCHSLETDARLTSFGLTVAYGQLVRLVAARARADRLAGREPFVGNPGLSRPVFLVGHMRSGTTRMHRLLACDPAFAANRQFEQLDPVPYSGRPDPRPLYAGVINRFLASLDSGIAAVHPTSPFAIEEDFGFQAFSIWGAQFEGQWHIPGFARMLEGVDPVDAYEEFAALLGMAARHRRIEGRPWLLKAPQFTQDLDAILGRFPDARLVVLRRPLDDVVASSASLAWHHVRLQSDEIEPRAVAQEWLRKTRLREERLNAALARFDQVPRVELDFRDVNVDWRGAVRSVYDMLGMELSAATERRMERFIARAREHRRHRYDLDDFGLDRRTVEAAFA